MAKGSWTSKSETGPSLPQNFGGDADHGAAKLAAKVKDHDPVSTHGLFLDDVDYKLDRKNVDQPIPKVDKGTQTGEDGSELGPEDAD